MQRRLFDLCVTASVVGVHRDPIGRCSLTQDCNQIADSAEEGPRPITVTQPNRTSTPTPRKNISLFFFRASLKSSTPTHITPHQRLALTPSPTNLQRTFGVLSSLLSSRTVFLNDRGSHHRKIFEHVTLWGNNPLPVARCPRAA